MPANVIVRSAQFLVGIVCLLLMPLSPLHAAGQAPEAPVNLTGSIESGIAMLQWDIPFDDDVVEGYNIYINDRYTTTVRTNGYSTPVQADTLYVFKVVAFDEVPRRFSPASQPLTLPASLVPEDLTIPPSIPTDLSGNVSGATVSLAWQASTDDEAVLGYNVYRDNRYLTTVRSPSYTGSNEPGESHSWYVVAFDIRTNFSARSARIVLPDPGPVDTTIAPSVPAGLSGDVQSGSDNDTVTVNWQPATDDQAVAGYNIYRNRQYIATRFGTEYIGLVEPQSSNDFSVVAFDFDGNFSASSKSITLPLGTAEVNPGKPPSVPTGLTGETSINGGQSQVQLSWAPSTSTVKVAGYNIYRNNSYHSSVFTNSYIDTVPAATAFSYQVVAFDAFGNFSAKSLPLNLLGESRQAPFFSDLNDQSLTVDESWELVLRPQVIGGGPAGILLGNPPAGLLFVDNRDGSRSLKWTPGINDVGSYEIIVTAFDLQDTDLRSSRSITLTVSQEPLPAAAFSILIEQAAYNLVEGNAAGVNIPLSLIRDTGFEGPVTLSVTGDNPTDDRGISSSFSMKTLQSGDQRSTLTLSLAVDVLPILAQQRSFTIEASDGSDTARSSITVAVTPVARDDVYLIIGQSNAVGFSEAGAKQSGPGGQDEIELRIQQANVRSNDSTQYTTVASYSDAAFNVLSPAFVSAQDPLHEPVDTSTLAKEGNRIGSGLSFAKAALAGTTRNIILVPAAWAGSAFCNTQAPAAHWNAQETELPELGNTLLFERSLTRINETLRSSGGILRGILWHQGESDATEECAPLYENNLISLVSELRSRISLDARGELARGPDANIPFVLATMSKGVDERGNLSEFPPSKLLVDSVHRNIANLVTHSDVVLADDLVPENGYPCGEGSCIHFGADALREIGRRSLDALIQASQESTQ